MSDPVIERGRNVTALAPSEIRTFLGRFGGFSDTVLQEIRFQLAEHASVHQVAIRLEAQDVTVASGEVWCEVTLIFDEVEEFRVNNPANTGLTVISMGIALVYLDDRFAIDFDGYREDSKTIEDFRASDAYAIGRSLSYSVQRIESA